MPCSWRISLCFLLHGTPKLVCYGGPVAAVGAALGERGLFDMLCMKENGLFFLEERPTSARARHKTHETRSYH